MTLRNWKTWVFTLAPLAVLGFGLFVAYVPGKEPNFDDFMKAHEAFNMEQYRLAAETFEPLAISGDQRAQTYMTDIEAFGLGRPINREWAKDWAARSDATNSRGGKECIVGIHWANGHFGTKNTEESAYWISYADLLRGYSFCLDSFQGKRLPDDLREEIEDAIRIFSIK